MAGVVEYPPEIAEAANNISVSATELNKLMGDLNRDKMALMAVSGGAMADSFNQVHEAFNRTGLTNSEGFQNIGKVTNTSHTEMVQFDQTQARKFTA
jgi:uncharacterized protein YukE